MIKSPRSYLHLGVTSQISILLKIYDFCLPRVLCNVMCVYVALFHDKGTKRTYTHTSCAFISLM